MLQTWMQRIGNSHCGKATVSNIHGKGDGALFNTFPKVWFKILGACDGWSYYYWNIHCYTVIQLYTGRDDDV